MQWLFAQMETTAEGARWGVGAQDGDLLLDRLSLKGLLDAMEMLSGQLAQHGSCPGWTSMLETYSQESSAHE